MTAEEVRVIITAQNREFNAALNDVINRVNDMDERTRNYESTASGVFRRLAQLASTLGIGKIISDSVMNGGELEQNLGGVEVVFRQHADSMKNAAKTAFEDMGLSESAYLATANKMGALLKGSGFDVANAAGMSQKAMQRAADVASIMGIDVSSAMEAVTGMAKGNFTMMDNLGVAINDTTLQIYAQEKGLGKLETTQQKVNAAMQMFLEKTEYAAGNYARENDTFSGSLTTFKAELENLTADLGTQLLPAASAVISMARSGLEAVSPLVISLGDGINRVALFLANLSPETKRLITFALIMATVIPAVTKAQALLTAASAGYRALLTILIPKQMTFAAALKATAGWIGIIVGALALLSMLKDNTDSTAESFEDESEGAQSAAESVDDLGDSIKNIGETTKKSLADIDKLNVFSGSSTLGSSIISAEDIENFSAADDIIKDLQENSNVDVGLNFDFDLNSIYNSIKKAIKWLTNDLWPQVFDFWLGVGSDIEKIVSGLISGDESAVYKGLTSLNDKFKEFFGDFGEDWSNFWQGVGAGIYDFANGDLVGGLNQINEQFKKLFGDLGEDWSNFWISTGSRIYEATHGDEINMQALQSKYNTLGGEMNAAIVEYLKQGLSSEDALKSAKSDVLTSSEALWYYENSGIAAHWADVEQWRKDLISSGQMYNYNDYSTYTPPSYSAAAQTDSMKNFRALESETPLFTIQNTTYVELDGETVGESSSEYSLRELMRANGY